MTKCSRCGKKEISIYGPEESWCATCWLYGKEKKPKKK